MSRFIRRFRRSKQNPSVEEEHLSNQRHGVHKNHADSLGSENGQFRSIKLNNPNFNISKGYVDNFLKTSKYSPFTFLCVNLSEQFKRTANFYFLIVTAIQLIPGVAPYSIWVTLGPLTLVLGVTALKEAYEDYKRHKHDSIDGAQVYDILSPSGTISSVKSRNIKVGDILWLKGSQAKELPADVVLLSCQDPSGVCYMSTANLDGETSLKVRSCIQCTNEIKQKADIGTLRGELQYGMPDPFLSNFNGSITLHSKQNSPNKINVSVLQQEEPLSPDIMVLKGDSKISTTTANERYLTPASNKIKIPVNSFMPKGAKLVNTTWAAAVVVYTGVDTKIALNLLSRSHKFSKLEQQLNIYVIGLFVFQVVVCLFNSIYGRVYDAAIYKLGWFPDDYNVFYEAAMNFCTMFVLFSWTIPLSIYVSLEGCKLIQVWFMFNDKHMNSPLEQDHITETDEGHTRIISEGFSAHTSDINEELGQVQFILTDKTGTLTQNIMKYSNSCVGRNNYDVTKNSQDTFRKLLRQEIQSNPVKETEAKGFGTTSGELCSTNKFKYCREFARIITVCNSVVVQNHLGKSPLSPKESETINLSEALQYSSESADEVALTDAMNDVGYQFLGRTFNCVKVRNNVASDEGDTYVEDFEVLAELSFSAEWKRQSVVVRTPEGQIWLYMKGADSAVLPLCNQDPNNRNKEVTFANVQTALHDFSTAGLRTLVFAARRLTEKEFSTWRDDYLEAVTSIIDADQMVRAVFQRIERGSHIVGCSGVEDKLQPGCADTINSLKRAGIKIAMATGDKMETAINIGYNVGLLGTDCHLMRIQNDISSAADMKDVLLSLINQSAHLDPNEFKEKAIVAEGNTITYCLLHHRKLFKELLFQCNTAIFCRMDPLQKSQVVALVKDDQIVLAIGDGANDVSMILASSVGIGIVGKEGRQAAAASDYQISTFNHLSKLLLVHGRWCYFRLVQVIHIAFYCNIAFQLPPMIYMFYAAHSGISIYPSTLLIFFNPLFAAPIYVVLGCMDQDLTADSCMLNPECYRKLNSGNSMFNMKTFFGWILMAFHHGLVVFYVPYFVFRQETMHTNGSGLDMDLIVFGQWQYGLTILSHALVSLISTRYVTIINVAVILLCIFFFGLFTSYFSSVFYYGELGGVAEAVSQNTELLLASVLVIVAVTFPHIALQFIKRFFYPEDWYILQEINVLKSSQCLPSAKVEQTGSSSEFEMKIQNIS